MVEIKPGDEYRANEGEPRLEFKVLFVGNTRIFIRYTQGSLGVENSLSKAHINEFYTKIEPWFEVGKTYRNATMYRNGYQDFECLGVFERNGFKVAFGWRGDRYNNWDWFDTFDGWQEV